MAAFAKRLARLTLVAPPQDIQIILMFIGNLILRHPGLKRLLNHPKGGEGKIVGYNLTRMFLYFSIRSELSIFRGVTVAFFTVSAMYSKLLLILLQLFHM